MFNFALAWAVPPGLSTIGWKVYFIFGTFNFAAFIHVLFMYPETVGRSLEEVEEIFKQGHTFSAWKIGKNVGKRTLADVKGATNVTNVSSFSVHMLGQVTRLTMVLSSQEKHSVEHDDKSSS